MSGVGFPTILMSTGLVSMILSENDLGIMKNTTKKIVKIDRSNVMPK